MLDARYKVQVHILVQNHVSDAVNQFHVRPHNTKMTLEPNIW